MKRFLIRWLLPFVIATVLAIILCIFVRNHIFRVSGNAMYPFAVEGNVLKGEKPDTIHQGDILLVVNPLDIKREEPRLTLSRCVAMPGEKVQIYHKRLYVNGVLQSSNYCSFDTRLLLLSADEKNAAINFYHLVADSVILTPSTYILTEQQFNRIKSDSIIKIVEQCVTPNYLYDSKLYPFSRQFNYNKDYYGPVIVPSKGMKINLNAANYLYYKYLFTHGEKVKVEYNNGVYFVDGVKSETYTFKHDYYFLLNDYRDQPSDSRTFGPVSEEEIVARITSVIF